jgi:uncharacterized membrane protein YvlD (DUF360 family)
MFVGFLLIWAITAFGLWLARLFVPGVGVRLTASLVSDFEVDDFMSAVLAALVMALLGILGFILIEWWMLGGVNWMMMDQHHGPSF